MSDSHGSFKPPCSPSTYQQSRSRSARTRPSRKRAASTSEKKNRRTPSNPQSYSVDHHEKEGSQSSHGGTAGEDEFYSADAESGSAGGHGHGHGQSHNLGQGKGKARARAMMRGETAPASTTAAAGRNEKAPSLDVDIRNSLILPSLSQRFSVLLPSLSTAPEQSLRSLLASQRARHNGPALTLEEEELLFAEIHDTANHTSDAWDGRPPALDRDWSSNGSKGYNDSRSGLSQSGSFPSLLTTSASSPSILTTSDDGASPGPYGGSQFISPPPTSNSFSSFKTFGVGASPEHATHAAAGSGPGSAGFSTKSYGFSGGSGMRDGEYIRRVKKSASHKDLKNGSISSRKSNRSNEDGTPTKEPVPLPPPISPEKANAYYQPTRRAASPTSSERTATPISSMVPLVHTKSRSINGHSPSASLSFSPQEPPTPESAEDHTMLGKQQRLRKRQSRLAGLTPAQVKRISLALEEIGGELRRGSSIVKPLPKTRGTGAISQQEVEEMLVGEDREIGSGQDSDLDSERMRRPSDIRSEESCTSAVSSVFPFKMSPTNSTFTNSGHTSTEPASPVKLPSSPKSYNLLAQVEEPLPPLPPIPRPVFTPTRSQPVRHQPSLSNSSTSTMTPNQPVYIPGQPRPVRSTHHSQSSTSSRSATPISQSPLDAIRSSTMSPDSSRLDHTPSPLSAPPNATPNSASLGRSRSVNQAQGTPTRPPLSGVFGDSGSSSFIRRRAGTVGEPPMDRRLSSTSGGIPSTPEIIEEAAETPSDAESGYTPYDEVLPELKQVTSRHSVAHSRRTGSEASVHQLRDNLGWNLSPSAYEPVERAVSMQGTIVSSNSNSNASPAETPQSPTTTLRRPASTDSLDSSFEEPSTAPSEIVWTNVFEESRPQSCEPDTDSPDAPGKDSDMLRKVSGLCIEDLARLQEKLVVKAKQEREALRGDDVDSPIAQYAASMSPDTFSSIQSTHRALSPPSTEPQSPPTSWRFPPVEQQREQHKQEQSSSVTQATTPFQEKSTLPSSTDTHILTPPMTGTASLPASAAKSHSQPIVISRPPPPPPVQPQPPVETPSETADEHIYTPPSTDLSRNPSAKAHHRLPLEEDPAIRRDFEARIAAATAALNRTPSTSGHASGNHSGSRLERKFTKKGGPMVISSPKLVSSTANVPTTPLTPENQIEPAVAKNLEKASGSGSKMSLRWKKLAGLRNKGPSFSGSEVTPFPPASASPMPAPSRQSPQHQPSQLSPPSQTSLQRSQSQSAARILDDPIDLRPIEDAPPSAPPNLNAFRFPPPPERSGPPVAALTGTATAPGARQQDLPSPPTSSGLRHVISKIKRKDDKHNAARAQSPPPHPDAAVSRAHSPQLVGTARRPSSPLQQTTTAMGARAQSPLPNLNAVVEDSQQNQSKHAATSSGDEALANFIEAGRQLGLDDNQLNAMIAAKGFDRSITPSQIPTNNQTQPPKTALYTSALVSLPSTQAPASPPSVKPPSAEKEKKGLFRSLSKSRKNHTQPPSTPLPVPPSLAPPAPIIESEEQAPPPAHDRTVVRRTMILPEGLNIIPSTPLTYINTPSVSESPDATLTRMAQSQGRKQSVRRKPLNLSKEDQELVSNSPPAHRREFSFGTNRSVSDSNPSTAVPTAGPSPAHTPGELHGLGFLHPNTPLGVKTAPSNQSLSPAASMDDDTHARSSTGGSLIDMYANNDDEEMLQPSPEKLSTSTTTGRFSFDDDVHGMRSSIDDDEGRRKRQTQAVEITEYADGRLVWNIVDALRTSVSGSVDGEEYTFDGAGAVPHSRNTSLSSSVRDRYSVTAGDVFGAHPQNQSGMGWPRGIAAGTQGLNFRHRERSGAAKPRPPTDIYFTSSRDVADLIDHLSQDLDASHGRIQFTAPHSPLDQAWPPSNSSPFMFRDSVLATDDVDAALGNLGTNAADPSSPNPQFEDAPSPAPTRRIAASPIVAPSASAIIPGDGLSPARQLFVQQGHARGPSYMSTGSIGGGVGGLSPSSKSFASTSTHGQVGRSVEDRLQALLDRLKDSGIGRP
ncbi:hypothetical protein I317_00424 [Kwoniella heveanensis CBS 569]|nr:hypothetical protein I317_00424 [Kwoniella heveanensis CBS 569]